ncbi:lebercilin [Carpediemonas membranifera]|uniref:Lebercilin n=1 Tax=Carpediemonas membranifera TaxID=201153 RepID=A0A8J6B9U3_9EUKA|nr:lebercilin [Carpediemonas membranifera]|eukprot:KAG9392952.1 lebercilin [Carpediemonas membranifera]
MTSDYDDDFEVDEISESENEQGGTNEASAELERLRSENLKLRTKVDHLTNQLKHKSDTESRPSSTRSMSSIWEKKMAIIRRDNARLSRQVQQYSVAAETITGLENKVKELRINMKKILDENKALKRVQREQEKALTRYDEQLAEPHQMVQAYQNEIRALKLSIRQQQSSRVDENAARKVKLAYAKVTEKYRGLQATLLQCTGTDSVEAATAALEKFSALSKEREEFRVERDKVSQRVKSLEHSKVSATKRLELQLKHAEQKIARLTEANAALQAHVKTATHLQEAAEFSPALKARRGGKGHSRSGSQTSPLTTVDKTEAKVRSPLAETSPAIASPAVKADDGEFEDDFEVDSD